ncbi:LysR family transcriptional regulator [Kibdelosporangium phytohabitans]|uniref:LysR family transcriptional regulator n=1 Tax=Kibdelosporangium phytohabitans TaxID=860235 RepID=A0A0N7F5H1_9PSEU|nr:LysR family transcriptional regulator [Kibdelosporangium phytohabitans]ALG14215.1 LysR family transcriptional regulator [Kibdelosporangium phytohabitans]MBE1466785.1 DNA-binding transcriptional LysR family regulator [Kibdelosporangium phytohabitans]
MELRQLEYFVAAAEECHFTRAAKRMHVAQSGLSSAIRSLERELGASLFIRSTRQVELTPAGRALLVEARRALSATDAARAAVAAVQGLIRGNLAVGSLQCVHVVNVPQILARFHAAHPGVEIQLRQGGSRHLVDQVRAGRLDVALVARPLRPVDDVLIRPLASEPLVLACALEHPLANRTEVSLHDLDGEPFVDFQQDWGSRDLVDSVLGERRIAFEVNDVHSLLDLVTFGLGVALVPQSFSVKTDKVQFVGIAGRLPSWDTVVVTSETASAAATALLDAVAAARSGRA